MPLKKTHKRRKSSRYHGRGMGSCGVGARKKAKGSGHRGGFGMAGTGKRADQKKTLITKLYGNKYFGKQGITSKRTQKDKRDRINVGEIQNNYKQGEINLETYKILGDGEIKNKFIIKAKEASKSAAEKVEAAGGKIILTGVPREEKKVAEVREKTKAKEGKK